MEQPYRPDPAWGVFIFTVLKVQLGTSFLLTSTDFILCPVGVCHFSGLSSDLITYSLFLCSVNQMDCIPMRLAQKQQLWENMTNRTEGGCRVKSQGPHLIWLSFLNINKKILDFLFLHFYIFFNYL